MWSHVIVIVRYQGACSVAQYDSGTLNSLNNHFQKVAVGPGHLSADTYIIPQKCIAANQFTFSNISVSLVLFHLNSLNPAKSTGPDDLPARFLREHVYLLFVVVFTLLG